MSREAPRRQTAQIKVMTVYALICPRCFEYNFIEKGDLEPGVKTECDAPDCGRKFLQPEAPLESQTILEGKLKKVSGVQVFHTPDKTWVDGDEVILLRQEIRNLKKRLGSK